MEVRWHYASDLTERQWQIIRQFLPPTYRRGRPPICRRRVVNAILYVVRTGCQWRMLPAGFPNWSTVYGVFWRWRSEGVWEKLHDALREKTRRRVGRKRRLPWPSSTANRCGRRKAASSEDTTPTRRFPVGSGIWPWTPSGWSWQLSSMQPIGKIRMALLGPGKIEGEVPSPEGPFRRCGLRSGELAGLCARDLRLDSANDSASGGAEEVRGAAQALDRGANIRLAGPLSPSQQRL